MTPGATFFSEPSDMGYENRRTKKWPDHLTVEEEEVQQALDQAGYERDPNAIHSFVPTAVLYQVYRDYIAGLRFRNLGDDMPVDLTTRQFGAALRRVLDLTDEEKVFRSYHGKRMRGYLTIVGPNAYETRDEPGRPKINVFDDDPTNTH
jgi:hypothetical protein